MEADGVDLSKFDVQLDKQFEVAATKAAKRKKNPISLNRADYLKEPIKLKDKASGRAPYSRQKMQEAWEAIFDDSQPDPKDKGGCLEETAEVLLRQVECRISEQTNNHLIRHRLLILQRLLSDIVKNYADNKPERINKIVLEVIRDLQEFSGKNAKEKAQLFGTKLASHRKAVAYLEKTKKEEELSFSISAGLIKKVRIAQEMNWKCPFTHKTYNLQAILNDEIDKEHIVPRSLRPSDSLESLVLTYRHINHKKGNRTALQFIEDEQNTKDIVTLVQYRKFVDSLKPTGSTPEDRKRCERRKALLLTKHFDKRKASQNEEGEEVGGFTGRDLTQTSHLNKLAALTIKNFFYERQLEEGKQPEVIHMPGQVTGAVRKSWNLIGTLGKANPQILDEDGKPRIKTEIREITHLHHALDAITLGLSAAFFPKNGTLWQLMTRRRMTEQERAQFKKLCRHAVTFNKDGQWQIPDLPSELKNEIADRLAEKRVVMHIPKTMDGLRVQQNTWRTLASEDRDNPDSKIWIEQTMRNPEGKRERKVKTEKASKLLGYGHNGKLGKLKGSLIIEDNYGVALDPEPKVIPFANVWKQVEQITEKNNGKAPRILRIGSIIDVPQGRYQGTWRVRSVKDNKAGMALDMSSPDSIKVENKSVTSKINVSLKTLVSDGLKISDGSYTAHPK